MTGRRWLVTILLVAIVGGALAASAAYLYRRGSAAAVAAPQAQLEPAPPMSEGQPRGDVSIDPRRQQLIGVRLAPAQRTTVSADVRTTGVVKYDETRLADVNLRIDGWIRDLFVDYTGQAVRKGQPLFTFYSPELIATENEFLLALKSRDQMKESQVADAREYADRLVDSARERLARFDLPGEQLRDIESHRRAEEAVTFPSPATGYVIEKQAIAGMHVSAGQTLYRIADLSTVWIEADVYEQEIAVARLGASALVTLDAYPGQTFAGRATYIYPYVDENSRTVKVRMQFQNPGGRLKPGMFAHVELKGAGGSGLTIPANALLDSGREQIVFVAQGDGVFSPRPVTVGRRTADVVEITKGLKEGEQVATGAAFFLDSESQLRAGLQNYEPPASTAAPAGGPAVHLKITFRTEAESPRTGDETFDVTVMDASGTPVSDAEVTVTLFMPAMPTMNMPAMRSETKLAPSGSATYRGTAQVVMTGRWDVTVNVSKGGQRLGTGQFALTAK